MTRPVYHCSPSEGYCECPTGCGLHYRQARTTDALAKFNRATTGFALSLILVAFIAAILAAGLIREEARLAHQAKIDQERNVDVYRR